MSRINDILGQLDTVKVEKFQFSDDNSEFYESFLQFCTNLKKLCIYRGGRKNFGIGIGNSWLRRKYPTLKHVELTSSVSYSNLTKTNYKLITFFEQNTNVSVFAISQDILLVNRNILQNIKHKLDILSIRFTMSEERFNSFTDLLIELYDFGLFKQLHVYLFESLHYFAQVNIVNHLNKLKGLTENRFIRFN